MLTEEELKNAPEGIKYTNAKMLDGLYYTMAISVLDCTGCGSCANVCPGNIKNDTLVMNMLDDQLDQQKYFDYASYLEFSGACAGCGETP